MLLGLVGAIAKTVLLAPECIVKGATAFERHAERAKVLRADGSDLNRLPAGETFERDAHAQPALKRHVRGDRC